MIFLYTVDTCVTIEKSVKSLDIFLSLIQVCIILPSSTILINTIPFIILHTQGYSLRLLHEEFFERYSSIAPQAHTLHQLVATLSSMFNIGADAWQVGETKMFLRSGA